MPVKRYVVEDGVVFTPKTLSTMGKALEATAEILGIGGDETRLEDRRHVSISDSDAA
jgi:hypothetical protein